MPVDPHKPLRDDVRLLGGLLGDTLKLQGDGSLLDTVERVRASAKSARAGGTQEFERLAATLAALPVDSALPVARAFAHFLTLANIAEQHHRGRRRREHRRVPGSPQRGSCEDAFQHLIAGGLRPEQLHDAVCALQIELVLTAHPTEVSRRTLVEKHNRIAALLDTRDHTDPADPVHGEIVAALAREIMTAWGTDEVRPSRPSPLDEVRGGLVVFEQSLWHTVPRYLREVDRALTTATGRGLPIGVAPVRFGSWIGGDRDGNPFVTPDVTRQACLLARWMAADLYLREVDALRGELSVTAASATLREKAGSTREPYRALLRGVRTRLAATRAWIEAAIVADTPPPPDAYLDAAELDEPLALCDASLRETGQGAIADGRLIDLRRRLAAFGLTLVRLDIRQDAARHTEALSAVTSALGLGPYSAWDEATRIAFLEREIAGRRPLIPADLDAAPDVLDTLETFRAIGRIPRASLGAYVITMASRASDVLAVELLQKACGVRAPLRAVPLFETSRDLGNAGPIVSRLLEIPGYRQRIHGRIEVMVGYSDSAKDVGRVAANWDLYRAQEAIVAACGRHDVKVTLFHGRGGSVGRGGGPTHLAIRSQPAGSIDGTLRVTEQGEMIQALFGLPEIALRTLEVYTSGTLEAWLTPEQPAPAAWRARMDALRDRACASYRAIVYEHPRFGEYFRAATPEAELAEMNIGSRPSRRASAAGVSGLRAIPWQFAWTQTRLMLGAWLGLEDALDEAFASGHREDVRQMYREWTHFRSAIDLMEMVLAKADRQIAAEYDRRLVPPDLQPLGEELRRRLDRAIALVLEVTGSSALLESNPVLRRSIDVRNPYVDPINLVQIELLCRARHGSDDRVRAALLATINGVAAGMRNTG